MQVTVEKTIHTAVEPTPRVMQVAAMFGIGVDPSQTIELIPPTTLTLHAGMIFYITGTSGGGKSTLLHCLAKQLQTRPEVKLLKFDPHATLANDPPLVDALPGLSLEQTIYVLSLAGLNDAFVMLRRVSQLSEGQRYRFALAQMFAQVQAGDERLHVVLADEFGATLDRLTAKILAMNLRKWTRKQRVCVLCATTHEDLIEPMQPNVLIEKNSTHEMRVFTRA